MQRHEHFEELAALAAIGQISEEEMLDLVEHLRGCRVCRQAGNQIGLIVEELPLPEASARDSQLQQMQSKSYRERFMRRAAAEGVHFTRAAMVQKPSRSGRRFHFHLQPFALGVASGCAVLTLAVGIAYPRYFVVPNPPPPAPTPAPIDENAIAPPTLSSKTPLATQQNAEEIARLEKNTHELEIQLQTVRHELTTVAAQKSGLESQLTASASQSHQLQTDRDSLKRQLVDVSARAQKLDHDNSQLTASLVEQQIRIEKLTEDVQTQMAAVEREKQLSAVAHDVRELMAARNLHIVDVADLNSQGKPKKSFGRVFFIEGKTLIFYAFDLSEKGSASKVTFQAWAQRHGGGTKVDNLGVFHIDDHQQKRWVLRVDDPALLKSVEAVFVTVEPTPGRAKPSGQKLLYAYLGTEANHP